MEIIFKSDIELFFTFSLKTAGFWERVSKLETVTVILGCFLAVFLVEPLGKNLEPSLSSKTRLWPPNLRLLDTIADSLRMPEPGALTFPILCDKAETVVFSMNDEEMVLGMRLGFERMKQVVEPASGAAIAAACSDKMKALDPAISKIGVILCGGNVDLSKLPF